MRIEIPVRRGFTLIELIGACLLLGMLFSITVPMLLVVARERRSTEQRQFAMQHVMNLLEHASTRNWEDLEPGQLNIPEADGELLTIFPGLERSLEVKQIDDAPVSREIVASVSWRSRAGEHVAPVRLSAWVYPSKEAP